jgi:hypothetical protein
VHPDEVELIERLAREAFIDGVVDNLRTIYGIEWDVPLDVEAKFGRYWNDEIVKVS